MQRGKRWKRWSKKSKKWSRVSLRVGKWENWRYKKKRKWVEWVDIKVKGESKWERETMWAASKGGGESCRDAQLTWSKSW